MTWCWYLTEHPTGDTRIPRSWYPSKATPSFLDALAALRRTLWTERKWQCPHEGSRPSDGATPLKIHTADGGVTTYSFLADNKGSFPVEVRGAKLFDLVVK